MSKQRTCPPPPTDRRGLLSAEHGPGAALASRAATLRVALVYPHTYHVGMSSLGFQIAWQTIAAFPGAAPERFFTDTLDQGSIESGSPLADFDIIAISATYEMDDPHILDILDAARLPHESRHRPPSAGHPLVVMGGVLVSVNRRPLYPFIDLFAHGEAEVILPALLSGALAAAEGRLSRPDLLLALADSPGFELTAGARAAAGLPVPDDLLPLVDLLDRDDPAEQFPEPPIPPRAFCGDLGGHPFSSAILTPHAEFSDMALIDLARGCPHHCTFCWIGHNAPVYRVRPLSEILAAVDRLSPFTDRFGLVASAVGAHPGIDELCAELMRRNLRVSYSSLRVEEVTPVMLRALAAGGQKSVTIAPEAGAPRVRRLLGKRISDEQIFDVAGEIFSLGVENLKMYFMIGIPSETDDEALEIATFTEKMRQIQLRYARPRGRIGSIALNLGVFVPKPEIPLNHVDPVPLAVVRKRLGKVVRALERIPNTRVAASSPDLARSQAILSMGGVDAARFVRLVRALGMDWRAATREWDRTHDARFFWQPDRPARVPATRLLRPAPAG